jgi:glutaconate CoA-transferase subunit A
MIRSDTEKSLDALVAEIGDGTTLAIPREGSPIAMAATRALIRKGVRNLKLVTVPTSSLQADLLIGAGCVAAIETAGVSLGELGQAPRFNKAVRSGAIAITDTTCPAVHAALQAAEKGIPFMPLRGIIGSDLAAYRDDWRIIDNPFGDDDPIMVLPAIRPDVALFHAPLADRDGNVFIGRDRELMLMAHASARTLVTVEHIRDESLLDDPYRSGATIPALYISGMAEARRGAAPLGLFGHYGPDEAHLKTYAELARSDEGFTEYLDRFVFERVAAAE